ncbi:dual 3, 5 -cyclic-AMP and -GMP phosphodiesterase 11A [Micractinium conductrix]|uniref:Dual 3, 5 -cyclic-AMP and -GMP phosphodiesterase 11A n=1 Tax=Micractinium conductrix TaxID=554055 RepID=A0A2P6VC81_9CHLO|nr:dual 3, 5 -cyclic-AMP and -GMP phosphodiesterase 11A [Micractinium conductrix]|eukprot:PSC71661.1 dual 3, 5 -cyclic-AMP and -GMP phosphodiesterase 11A [Micractinium conductrix]
MATKPRSGIKPPETWVEGTGGVFGTGRVDSFYNGGYGSTGSMGCMPLGCFELRTVPSSPSFFAARLAQDFLSLDLGPRRADSKELEEPSPKSDAGAHFDVEVIATEAALPGVEHAA